MRVLKDDKYNAILDAARNEFIGKGFKDASMRNIAKVAGVGLSNIYNYFMNKDDLFLAIVKPAKDTIFSFITNHHTEEEVNLEWVSTFHYQEEAIDVYIGLLEKYKEELRLLLYRSEGSSMSNFRDVFTDHLTDVSNDYMNMVKNHYHSENEISPFFIHTLSAFMVSIVGEIITHNLNKESIKDFFLEYFRFELAGWRELTGV